MTPADLDQLARDVGAAPVLPPPGDEDEQWSALAERLRHGQQLHAEAEERRGRLVAVIGDIAIVATCAGCLLVAIWCIGLAIWRRL